MADWKVEGESINRPLRPQSIPLQQQLDDELTCSVCLDRYDDPKALPCLHSFCLNCIKLLPQREKVR